MRNLSLNDINTEGTSCEWCGQAYRYDKWLRACQCSNTWRSFSWAFTADRQGWLIKTDEPSPRGEFHFRKVVQAIPCALRRLHAGKVMVLTNVYRDPLDTTKIATSWWWEIRIREVAS